MANDLEGEQVISEGKNIANLVRFSCPFCGQPFDSMDGKPWHIIHDGRFEINCYACGLSLSGKLTLSEVQLLNDPEPYRASWDKPDFPKWQGAPPKKEVNGPGMVTRVALSGHWNNCTCWLCARNQAKRDGEGRCA